MAEFVGLMPRMQLCKYMVQRHHCDSDMVSYQIIPFSEVYNSPRDRPHHACRMVTGLLSRATACLSRSVPQNSRSRKWNSASSPLSILQKDAFTLTLILTGVFY